MFVSFQPMDPVPSVSSQVYISVLPCISAYALNIKLTCQRPCYTQTNNFIHDLLKCAKLFLQLLIFSKFKIKIYLYKFFIIINSEVFDMRKLV